MGHLDNVWHQQRLSRSTKLRIYVSLVLSVVLYGSETWTMRKNGQWQGQWQWHCQFTRNLNAVSWEWNGMTRSPIPCKTTRLTDLPFLITDWHHSLFGHISRLSSDTTVSQAKHYIYPLTASPAHLLPPTGSAHRTIHRELAFNRGKIWVYPSVPVNLQPRTTHCRDRYDPQLVKRSSEWVNEWIQVGWLNYCCYWDWWTLYNTSDYTVTQNDLPILANIYCSCALTASRMWHTFTRNMYDINCLRQLKNCLTKIMPSYKCKNQQDLTQM